MWSLARTVYRYPACTACIQFSCKWVIISLQLKLMQLSVYILLYALKHSDSHSLIVPASSG